MYIHICYATCWYIPDCLRFPSLLMLVSAIAVGLFFISDDPYLYDVILLFKTSRVKAFLRELVVLVNGACTALEILPKQCAWYQEQDLLLHEKIASDLR